MHDKLLYDIDIYITVHMIQYIKYISKMEGWNYIDLLYLLYK